MWLGIRFAVNRFYIVLAKPKLYQAAYAFTPRVSYYFIALLAWASQLQSDFLNLTWTGDLVPRPQLIAQLNLRTGRMPPLLRFYVCPIIERS